MLKKEKALLLFSGGQDSSVCLAWALEHFSTVETICFVYGQRHAIETLCQRIILERLPLIIPSWSQRLGSNHILTIDSLNFVSNTALTRITSTLTVEKKMSAAFVPGRNLLFFTYAANVAWQRALYHLVGGMCEVDYSGYPDCQDDTLKSLQVTLNLGMTQKFTLHTPLMHLSKATTWKLAESLGGEDLIHLIRLHSHSCYSAHRVHLHEWGYGCGKCSACYLRAKGWAAYLDSKKNAEVISDNRLFK